MKTIEITIDVDGKISLDLDGFQGKGCSDVIKKLTKAMSAQVLETHKKPAYYKPEIIEKQKIKQG